MLLQYVNEKFTYVADWGLMMIKVVLEIDFDERCFLRSVDSFSIYVFHEYNNKDERKKAKSFSRWINHNKFLIFCVYARTLLLWFELLIWVFPTFCYCFTLKFSFSLCFYYFLFPLTFQLYYFIYNFLFFSYYKCSFLFVHYIFTCFFWHFFFVGFIWIMCICYQNCM